jgi:hypothetical protein
MDDSSGNPVRIGALAEIRNKHLPNILEFGVLSLPQAGWKYPVSGY